MLGHTPGLHWISEQRLLDLQQGDSTVKLFATGGTGSTWYHE
jgi:hypothetical protein